MSGDEREDYRSLGEILQACRAERRLSLEDVSEATKISSKMLQALEADEIDRIAGPIYARGFVKTLAAYFGQDEGRWLSLLEELDHQTAAPESPVHLEGEEKEEAVEPSAPPAPSPSPEPVTWKVETVEDTAVKRVVGGGGASLPRWMWIVLVGLILALVVWWLGGRSGEDSREFSSAAGPAPTADLSVSTAEPTASGDGASTASPAEGVSTASSADGASAASSSGGASVGSSPTASSPGASSDVASSGGEGSGGEAGSPPPADTAEEPGTEVVQPRGNTLDDAVPVPDSKTIDLEHAILAGGGGRPQLEEPSAPQRREGVEPVARPEDGKDEGKKEAETAAKVSPAEAPASTVDEGEDSTPSSSLGSIVRPGVQPPVAGQMRLDLTAVDGPVEVWAAADGDDLQHRVLRANESWSLLGRDHFVLRLPDPGAIEVKLDGVRRRPPQGLRDEWLIYPTGDSR